MSAFVKIINADSFPTRDAAFQAIPSATVAQGVQKDYLNELAITTNQIDTGRAFITMKRTTTTPNEEFLTVVEVNSAQAIDTTGDGYIVISLDQTRLNDPSSIDATGSNVATIEKVAVLPADNYILLASLASGVITDERTWAVLNEEIIPTTYFYDEDEEVSDTYVITINGIKEYTDGMEVAFKAATANTDAATLNINSIGAKEIVKNHNITLTSGDIDVSQIVEVRYNATDDVFEMTSQVANPTSVPQFASEAEAIAGTITDKMMSPLRVNQSTITHQFNAIENIIGGNAVCVLDYEETPYPVASADNIVGWSSASLEKDSSEIVGAGIHIQSIQFEALKIGTPLSDLFVRIETDSGGLPSGTLVDANAIASIPESSLTTTRTAYKIDFADNILLASGTTYHIVFECTPDASNYYAVRGTGSSLYANKGATFNGSIWTETSDPLYITLFGASGVSKTQANNTELLSFVGFANGSATAGNSLNVKVGGIISGLTGLETNKVYYLSDTAGEISTTAGTNSVKVGRAISSTELLIIQPPL